MTDELSLRVSIATLVRIVSDDSENTDSLLALERTATFLKHEGRARVKAQAFGGAIRINDLEALRQRCGDFHFDSKRSRGEADFRILIPPATWNVFRDFCLEQFRRQDESVLEISPVRELIEEFKDASGIHLRPDQFHWKPLWTLLENKPAATENPRAVGLPTVRIYRVCEARILDGDLWDAIFSNSQKYSDRDLGKLASRDARAGGKGWKNAFLVLPEKKLQQFFLSLSEEERNFPVLFEDTLMADNVPALLGNLTIPKYEKLEEV